MSFDFLMVEKMINAVLCDVVPYVISENSLS
jgi:hypothetical protein